MSGDRGQTARALPCIRPSAAVDAARRAAMMEFGEVEVPTDRPLVAVSYGGGVNSTALLIGCAERKLPVDLILFADTGGERAHTYRYRDIFSAWCVDHGLPPIVTVHRTTFDKRAESLESDCTRKSVLPSLAYGYKSCSLKFKRDPQNKYMNNWPPAKAVWKRGGVVVKYIGYDADEPHRAKIKSDKKYTYEYPLLEWDWGREECLEAIDRAGLPSPGKSACFFCPASKKPEILALPRELKDRAIHMERLAIARGLNTVKGLGRGFSWESYINGNHDEDDMIPDADIACECYDG